MSLPDQLNLIFGRITQNQQTDADMKVLRQSLSKSCCNKANTPSIWGKGRIFISAIGFTKVPMLKQYGQSSGQS